MKTVHTRKARYIGLILVLGILATPLPSMAGFSDDFEDGNHDGWFAATNGGSSTDGVELHNGSLMAYVAHTGTGSPTGPRTSNENSLTHDFAFSASQSLSFDMQAVATSASTCCIAYADGKAGVTLTFLNIFNVAVGSAGLYFSTSPSLLAANENPVDSAQHHYAATMATFASLAGISDTSSISTVSLTFRALGQFVGGGNIYPTASGTGKVWFDNVMVAVPEPASYAMLLAGLVLLGLIGLRTNHKKALHR